MTDRPEMPFVCVHNAERSQIAASLLEHHAQGQVVIGTGWGRMPVFSGKRYLDWQLDEPAGQDVDPVPAHPRRARRLGAGTKSPNSSRRG